jgi:hypothetical protein
MREVVDHCNSAAHKITLLHLDGLLARLELIFLPSMRCCQKRAPLRHLYGSCVLHLREGPSTETFKHWVRGVGDNHPQDDTL